MTTAGLGSQSCVVDASVGIKFLLVEPLSDRARRLLDSGDPSTSARLYVPDLFYVECANVLWKHVRIRGYQPDAARDGLSDLVGLALHRVPTVDIIEDTLPIALAYELSAYDAACVSLSVRLTVPPVTADEALIRKLRGAPFDARWLGDSSFG